MRDFFKSELETLKAKTGLNQYENMSAMPDAAFQFKVLLDSLVIVCEKFPMIPDEAKKSIIRDKMITDPEFNNLNSRKVWAWMEGQRAYYMTHEERKQEFGPIVFEPISETTQKKIDEYLNELRDFTPKLSGVPEEMKRIQREDKERVTEKKGTPSNMPSWIVPIEDDEGKVIKEISNVLAPTQEKAQALVELSIREGKIKI